MDEREKEHVSGYVQSFLKAKGNVLFGGGFPPCTPDVGSVPGVPVIANPRSY